MKRTKTAAGNISAGLITGVLVSMVIIILGCGIMAKLVEGEILEEEQVDYGVMVFLILSAYSGAMVSFGRIKKKRLLVCVASGVLLFGVLTAITGLLFGAEYKAVGVKAMLIFCGSFLAVLPGFRENRGGKIKKIKIANC